MTFSLLDTGQNCAQLLPVNQIKQTLTFFKISLFDLEVTLEDFEESGRLPRPKSLRLGLPQTVIHPYLSAASRRYDPGSAGRPVLSENSAVAD